MAWGNWMALSYSLEAQAQIAIHRQEVREMSEADVRALADSLVVQTHHHSALLRSAMRRIAELEVKHALVDAHAMAASLQRRKQGKLRTVLRGIFNSWSQWWRRR